MRRNLDYSALHLSRIYPINSTAPPDGAAAIGPAGRSIATKLLDQQPYACRTINEERKARLGDGTFAGATVDQFQLGQMSRQSNYFRPTVPARQHSRTCRLEWHGPRIPEAQRVAARFCIVGWLERVVPIPNRVSPYLERIHDVLNGVQRSGWCCTPAQILKLV